LRSHGLGQQHAVEHGGQTRARERQLALQDLCALRIEKGSRGGSAITSPAPFWPHPPRRAARLLRSRNEGKVEEEARWGGGREGITHSSILAAYSPSNSGLSMPPFSGTGVANA
jgi:hypothetical protein